MMGLLIHIWLTNGGVVILTGRSDYIFNKGVRSQVSVNVTEQLCNIIGDTARSIWSTFIIFMQIPSTHKPHTHTHTHTHTHKHTCNMSRHRPTLSTSQKVILHCER